MERFGDLLRRSRLLRNLSQEAMAERVGVTRKTYADLEAGGSSVSLGLLVRTLTVLGFGAEALVSMVKHDPDGDEIGSGDRRKRAGSLRRATTF